MIVLVALVGLTALAAAGMVITETQLRASENQEAGMNAFYAADAGLQQYLGTKVVATSTDTFAYAAGSGGREDTRPPERSCPVPGAIRLVVCTA